uniref:Uncharacterized protein n=1 Tax=Romanomermis culicivorax TaxID=13658 RepID=A0A915IR35_ROMCU
MGGVHGIDDSELLSPEAGDPSQNERGNVMRYRWLLFVIRGTVVVTEILVQGQRCICRTDVNGHCNANA